MFSKLAVEFGVAKSVDLVPNGSNIAVTRENRLQYIYSMSHYRLSKQIKLQSEAFFEGLSEMIDPKWIRYGSSSLGFSFCASTSSDLCHFSATGCLISRKFRSSLEV